MSGVELGARAALRENLLQEVKSPALADLMPEAHPAAPAMDARSTSIRFVQAYNTNMVTKDQPAQDLRGSAAAGVEGQARHRSRGLRLVRAGGHGAGRGAGSAAVPRHRRHQWHLGAQGPQSARQSGGRRRGAARAHRLRLSGRAGQAQGRADRLVRDPAGDRAPDGAGVAQQCPASRMRRCCSTISCSARRSRSWPAGSSSGEPQDREPLSQSSAQAHRFRRDARPGRASGRSCFRRRSSARRGDLSGADRSRR